MTGYITPDTACGCCNTIDCTCSTPNPTLSGCECISNDYDIDTPALTQGSVTVTITGSSTLRNVLCPPGATAPSVAGTYVITCPTSLCSSAWVQDVYLGCTFGGNGYFAADELTFSYSNAGNFVVRIRHIEAIGGGTTPAFPTLTSTACDPYFFLVNVYTRTLTWNTPFKKRWNWQTATCHVSCNTDYDTWGCFPSATPSPDSDNHGASPYPLDSYSISATFAGP